MAKTMNDKGELPIFMIYSTPLNHQERIQIQTRLLKYSLQKNYLPLNKNINTKDILKKHTKLIGTPTYDNIRLGCESVFEARKIFNASYSHPEVNTLSESKRNSLRNQLREKRVAYSGDLNQDSLASLKRKTDYFSTSRMGNCGEFSYATQYCFLKKNIRKTAGVWEIPTGDHVFNIIEPNTPYAVFCDPLAGKVFPANQLKKYLKAYYIFEFNNSFYNIYTRFNPNYHYIKQEFSSSSEKKIDDCISSFTSPYQLSKIDIRDIKSADINKPYLEGMTLLTKSINQCASSSCIDKILSAKADPNVKTEEGETSLHYAAKHPESTAIIKSLLKSNANTELTNNIGETPLLVAVSKGNYNEAKILLEAKADPNHSRINDATPLFFVNKNEHNMVKLLIEHQADVNHNTQNGNPLIHQAIFKQNINLLKVFLEELRLDVNKTNSYNLTALYLAAEAGLTDQVRLLIDHKADARIKFQNKSPLDIAKEKNHETIVELLTVYEASYIESERPTKRLKKSA